MKLGRDEIELIGKWVLEKGAVTGDETCRRIKWLTTSHLEKLKTDDSGWDVLYRDPEDGRYWELTYPQSEMQGGGPPTLKYISEEAAKSRYGMNNTQQANQGDGAMTMWFWKRGRPAPYLQR
jgi:hypothetical protein